MIAIEPLIVQVALKKGSKAASFTSSRSWVVPSTILHLEERQLALVNVLFLIPDIELACDDVLIRYPILRHLRIYSKTILEQNSATLDVTEVTLEPATKPI